MKCPRCQRENPADAVFCPECGAGWPSIKASVLVMRALPFGIKAGETKEGDHGHRYPSRAREDSGPETDPAVLRGEPRGGADCRPRPPRVSGESARAAAEH